MIHSSLRDLLKGRAAELLKSKGKDIDVPSFDLGLPPSKINGDLAANLPLLLAKHLGTSPKNVGEDIIKTLPAGDLVEKIELAGPGFLNIVLKDSALRSELFSFLQSEQPAVDPSRKTEKILLEFVSANPTGPLHVGHGRGAALGDSLVRIFRSLGHQVTAEFYVNDSGGQIRKLGYSVEARVRGVKGEPENLPEDGYKGSYVIDIAKEAVASGKKFNPVEAAQMIFDENDLAGYASDKNLKVIQKDLDDFDVHFDTWFKESNLHKKNAVDVLFKELEKKGYVYESEGAVWFKATEFGDEKDRVLRKGNEAPTYFAADIAYHAEKFGRHFDHYINIWGADHHGYAQRLKGSLKALGRESEKLEIIFNQLVAIKGGRLSKRAGDMVSLRDLFTEVGKDAARFFFALRSPNTHFEFDLDLAKKQASENPVFYVQYVHARCCSIFKEAEKRGFSTTLSTTLNSLPKLESSERAVILHLMNFTQAVQACANDRSTHHLTIYLMELAGKYHSFYEQCQVLVDNEALRGFRLALVDAIRKTVARGLLLLGVGAPEKL
jgi:arginyl-tRNA synthetase